MIGASKILTVSYGTFSCTLEGFDEPFNTMKAIAEYFRDLAADDRYFGAEPPTPDAAMLHKIAEREVQRRVEAKIGDNGVHLTAQEPAMAELPAPVAVPVPAVGPTLNAMPEGVAARLAKIRASVAQGDAVVVPAAVATISEYTEDQHADAMADDMGAFAMFDDAEIAPMDIQPQPDFAAEAEVAQDQSLPAEDDVDVETLADLAALDAPVMSEIPQAAAHWHTPEVADFAPDADVAPPADPAAADVPFFAQDAADVALDDLALPAEAEADDFDMADLDLGPDTSLPAETLVEPDDDMAADDGFDMARLDLDTDVARMPAILAEPSDAAGADDDSLISRLGELIDPDDAEDARVTEPMPTFADTDDVTLPQPVADTPEMPADAVADIGADVADMVQDTATQTPAVTQESIAPADPAEATTDLTDKLQRARARVIRIRRNPDTAVAAVAVEAPVSEIASAPVIASETMATPTLSDAAEAELARELAALELDTPATAEPVVDEDDAELRRQLAMIGDDTPVAIPTPTVTEDVAAHTAMADAVQDAAVSRLMQQTQSEMAVPENRRRLSAIAHLKAAVAATVAERFGSKAKPEEAEATRTEPYRDDLARVVRPRRPEGSGVAPVRPAPLVLVSEQRIDRPVVTAPVTVTPVRPRRVSSAALAPQLDDLVDDDEDLDDDDNIFTDARGFAEFADRLGAHSLPDMLEAAAAYAATVEGRPSFSRPQLMRQVSIATGEAEVSREDGLRSFGAMLRDGRIVKVRRGQFSLTAQSRFLTEAKKIAD